MSDNTYPWISDFRTLVLSPSNPRHVLIAGFTTMIGNGKDDGEVYVEEMRLALMGTPNGLHVSGSFPEIQSGATRNVRCCYKVSGDCNGAVVAYLVEDTLKEAT